MRDIIEKNEGKLTVLRFIGFCLMAIGVVSLMICSFETKNPVANIIAISFFITMLGFSLAFPSLLEGNEGLSTMRIVVFMMTNVICMLMLKIGWGNEIDSLKDIGIDQYWVGIIAFTFGAKATQSFFESRMAVFKEPEKVGIAALEFTSADIARLAILQNKEYLMAKYLNIITISDAVSNSVDPVTHVIAIYLKDDNSSDIPSVLEVRMPDNTIKIIGTEIIKGTGKAKIQYSQLRSEIARDDNAEYAGSICCAVESKLGNNTFRGIVTSAHIYSEGIYNDKYNGMLNLSEQTPIILNGVPAGKWYYKIMDFNQDFAVAKLNDDQSEDLDYMKFNNQFYKVTDKDVKTKKMNVTMLSKGNKTKEAFIIDYNIGFPVYYDNGPFYKKKLILIGDSNDREKANPISDDGDSGSCIYHTKSKKLIGMLLGKNEKFSLVLPLEDTLDIFNLKTV
ncbi:hypothetical protein [Flavobacterium humi]|uniref:Serine protease n=1 Tax=Flavobacterium humi TaxID=2562683 RepID=A0A4Z0L972_9FLAO|nr:hypothetical protein [Flavobacterium humi]TGD59015.1 hypothetical protein E4635_03960 [Flavobacterium humi]